MKTRIRNRQLQIISCDYLKTKKTTRRSVLRSVWIKGMTIVSMIRTSTHGKRARAAKTKVVSKSMEATTAHRKKLEI